MVRKTENFRDNIVFKDYLANNNSKVLGNQNLQLMYDFNFNNYLDVYICSECCRIPKHQFYDFNIQNNRMAHPKVNEYL